MKGRLLGLYAVLGALVVPVLAADTPPLPAPATSAPGALAPIPVSLSRYLQLQPVQLERLDHIYDGYASRRRGQESKIIDWETRLRTAQALSSFDAKKATALQQNINEAKQKVVTDFLACRGKALEVLPPVQRSQLQALATDPRFDVSQNAYYELLLMPVDEVWDTPVRTFEGKPGVKMRDGIRPSVDVYGGYGYGGPHYGVGIGAGRGPVGARVGIGRGGASFGIGIGGIFSGRRW